VFFPSAILRAFQARLSRVIRNGCSSIFSLKYCITVFDLLSIVVKYSTAALVFNSSTEQYVSLTNLIFPSVITGLLLIILCKITGSTDAPDNRTACNVFYSSSICYLFPALKGTLVQLGRSVREYGAGIK